MWTPEKVCDVYTRIKDFQIFQFIVPIQNVIALFDILTDTVQVKINIINYF